MGEVNLGSAHSQEGWVKTSQQRGIKPVVGMVELCLKSGAASFLAGRTNVSGAAPTVPACDGAFKRQREG